MHDIATSVQFIDLNYMVHLYSCLLSVSSAAW